MDRQRPPPRRSTSSQSAGQESTLEQKSALEQESRSERQSRLESQLSALKQDYGNARVRTAAFSWCESKLGGTPTSNSASNWEAANRMRTILDVLDQASGYVKDLSYITNKYGESLVSTIGLSSEIEKRIRPSAA